jgi:hypothetical protein
MEKLAVVGEPKPGRINVDFRKAGGDDVGIFMAGIGIGGRGGGAAGSFSGVLTLTDD